MFFTTKVHNKIIIKLPVKFPAGIAHLATSLTNMDGDTFTLETKKSNKI
jgi:hypothetical protein